MEQEKEKVKIASAIAPTERMGTLRIEDTKAPKKPRGRPSESDKKELKEMIPNMTNAEAKDLVEYYKKKYIESQISN